MSTIKLTDSACINRNQVDFIFKANMAEALIQLGNYEKRKRICLQALSGTPDT